MRICISRRHAAKRGVWRKASLNRAVSGERSAFAYSNDLSLTALHQAAQTVRAIRAHGGQPVQISARSVKNRKRGDPPRDLYRNADPLTSLAASAKVALLERIEQMARTRDPRITQVMASLSGEYDVVLIARGDGGLAADARPLVRVSVTVIAQQNGRRETGSAGG